MSRNYKDKARNRAKSNNQSRGKRDSFKPKFDKATATNSPEWYATDPALLRDSASIPFSWSVGTPINLHNPVLDALKSQEFAVPGICALELVPSIGYSADPADPINVAMFQFYSDVRYANSGHSNYDAPDLFLYIMAMSQVYSYINYLQRIYGSATLYAQRNRYLPDALMRSMRVNPDDIKANLANFRYGINMLINKAASFYVPAVMPIFNRQASLYSNIYVEGVSIKDQMYLYIPKGFWKFTLNDDQSGMLQFEELPSMTMTSEQLLAYGNDMLARLTMSEDMNIMSGDILKAYGESAMIKLQSLPTEYPIVPLFDAAVLEQIKNATVLPHLDTTTIDVVQDATHNHLVHTPKCVYEGMESIDLQYVDRANSKLLSSITEDRILTTQNLEPTPEIVMENTRLMATGFDFSRSEDGLSAEVCITGGSELVTRAMFWRYEGNSVDGSWTLMFHSDTSFEVVEADEPSLTNLVKRINIASPFKFRPFVHVFPFRAADDGVAFQVAEAFLNFDVDNYAVLSHSDLEHIHATALMSEMHVRSVNKIG